MFHRLFRFVLPAVAVVLHATLAAAQGQAPGGFIEPTSSQAARTVWTAAQIQSFLPTTRGRFTFPAPYNTEGIRLTIPSDCSGTDCVYPVGYSYWMNMNNHQGSDTMYIFLGLKGGVGPTLFSYTKSTGQVQKLGPLFAAGSALASGSGEGYYFSGTQPTKLYVFSDTRLRRYDVLAKTFETVLDIGTQTALYGSNRYIWQTHSTPDDRVHIGTVRDSSSYAMLGCFVYEADVNRYRYFPKTGDLDECNIDKSGRWLIMVQNEDGLAGEDNRIVDLQTGTSRLLLDQNGAGGHMDTGYGYMVAEDNWSVAGAVRTWEFDQATLQGLLSYQAVSWGGGGIGHVAHADAKAGVDTTQQYVCGGSATTTVAPRANEIFCFRPDSSLEVLVLTQNMTNLNAAGGSDSYSKLPKGNLDITGGYFIWTTNMGGGRLDAFLVHVPSQLLVGGSGTPDTTPPVVSLTAPVAGDTVSGTLAVSADATDGVGVAGVQFKLDGANLGAEDTTAPYTVSWNTVGATNSAHTLSAVARDAAGNTALSPLVGLTVSNTTPGVLTVTPTSLVFGSVSVGASANRTLTVSNTGGSTLSGAATTSAPFGVVGTSAYTLAAGQSTVLTVQYTPTQVGNASGKLTLTGGAGASVTLTGSSVAGGGAVTAVVWTSTAGVAVSSNNLSKTAATGWDNAGAVSSQTLAAGDGYVEFVAQEKSKDRMLGLSQGDSSLNYADIDFALDLSGKGRLRVYEKGSFRGNFGTYSTGDTLRVAVTSGVVTYSRNGNVFYASAALPTYPLLVDTSLYSTSATLAGVVLGGGGWSGTSSIAQGLVAYLKLDEASGTVAVDASGNGNAGTLMNGPSWTAGSRGNAVSLDGSDDYVRVAHAASLDGYPLSVGLRFRTASTSGLTSLLNKYVAGSYNGYQIFLNNGNLCAWYLRDTSNYVYDGGACTMSASGYADGLWHQAVLVVDAQGGRLYVDGVQKASQPWTGQSGPATTTQELRLGSYPGIAPGGYLPGTIDDLRIYSRALSSSEVTQLYSAP